MKNHRSAVALLAGCAVLVCFGCGNPKYSSNNPPQTLAQLDECLRIGGAKVRAEVFDKSENRPSEIVLPSGAAVGWVMSPKTDPKYENALSVNAGLNGSFESGFYLKVFLFEPADSKYFSDPVREELSRKEIREALATCLPGGEDIWPFRG